jgi:hypothetical protein
MLASAFFSSFFASTSTTCQIEDLQPAKTTERTFLPSFFSFFSSTSTT